MDLKKIVPIVGWLPRYGMRELKGDALAGITVGIMLIPQGMAYAMLAGLEPIHGLYVATVPLLLYTVFGTSRHLGVGPVAIVSLLTAAGIATLRPDTPGQYLIYAVTLALLVGLIQLLMGILRLGFMANFLSHPVINGFTSAAAIIIGLSQVKHLFSIPAPDTGHPYEVVLAIFDNLDDIHWLTFGIGVFGILIIKYGKKIHPVISSPLVAVILGIALVSGFGLDSHGVKIMGEVPGGLPGLSVPSFDLGSWSVLLPIAVTISLVGFAESFAVAKTIQSRHKDYKLDADQELIALGVANIGAAFFKGYPVTGGFSRTAVSSQAGAKTTMATAFAALLIALTLVFFTGLFHNLPNAMLAAVILAAVFGLVDVKEPVNLWRKDKADFSMLMVTFVTTLMLGVEAGIITGMVLSLLMVIHRASRPHVAQLGRVPDTNVFRNIKRFQNLEVKEDVLMVRIDGPIYFANVKYIKDKMDKWAEKKRGTLKTVIINLESVPSIDSTGIQELREWVLSWRMLGIETFMTSPKGPVRDTLRRWDFVGFLGADHLFIDDITALEYVEKKLDNDRQERFKPYVMQSN